MPKFYTRFNPPPSVGVEYNESEGRTLQQFKNECDIALTVKKYGNPDAFMAAMRLQNAVANMSRPAMYGDFSELPDLQEAMNAVKAAEQMFMDLPAEIRDRFANDPVKLLEFVRNPDNLEEAIKLGIVNKRAEKAPESATLTQSATQVPDGTATAPVGDSGESVSRA